MLRSCKLATAVCIGLVILALCSASTAQGATLTVTNLNDSGPGSLRDAIAAANSGDTIVFAVAGTITLTSGELVIDKDQLSIDGPVDTKGGALTIRGNRASRVFTIRQVRAFLRRLFMSDGSAGEGGGINNIGGTLTVMDCTLSGNSATGGSGGAILNTGGGSLTLINTRLTNNTALFGGGISSINGGVNVWSSTLDGNMVPLIGGGGYHAGGTMTITNSTVSNNRAGGGGGLFLDSLAGVPTVVNLVQNTISGNTASDFGAGIARADGVDAGLFSDTIFRNIVLSASGIGGGLAIGGSPAINMRNTAIAENQAANGPDCAGPVNSGGWNAFLDLRDCVVEGDTDTNLVAQDLMFGALQNNGGSTLTHLPDLGSPAVGAADPNGPTDETGSRLPNDQRGNPRSDPGTIGSVDPRNPG